MATRGKDGPAAALASRPLTRSSVYVRVRPLTTTGDCAHTDGEPVNKKLAGFDEATLTVQDDDLREKTTFEVTKVVPPEADQQSAFDEMAADLVDGFITDTNVFFFAYGQTGSGKTYTMLGDVESLSSEVPVPGWGLFPRVIHSTLESMKKNRGNCIQSVLLVSAVEFYCGAAFDLNTKYRDAKDEVTLDRSGSLLGAKTKEVKSIKGLRKWISRMYANRTTAKTNMNDASSRSHCAFVLTLLQLRADDTYMTTTFSMIDMAGSERSSKTGAEHTSGNQASIEALEMMKKGTPELLSIGSQGTLINMEISGLTTEIMKAAENHKKGIPYKAQMAMMTAAQYYFCTCCDGRARLGACVTVSPSPQHGFETWFSLKYAEQLAACRVPLVIVKPVPIDQALEAATRASEEAAANLAKLGPHPQSAAQHRLHQLARGEVSHAESTIMYLRRMVDQKAGKTEVDYNSDLSNAPWQSPLAPRRANGVIEAPEISALEMGKINENFSVFIRIRPLLDREKKAGAKNCFVVSDIEHFPRDPPPQRITVQESSEADAKGSFVFNQVFDDSHSQHDVYRGTAQPYVADFLGGTNVTIFAYGQTGTGKTHTIMGPTTDTGIIPRCLVDIFENKPAGKKLTYEYVQLYMDEFKDLLVQEPPAELKLVDGKHGVKLQNLTTRAAQNEADILQALEEGGKRRVTRSQDMNTVSSRSHAVLMLRLADEDADPDGPYTSMFIVDLAGNERVARSGVTGQGFDEATSINLSLTALGRVVVTLIEAGSGAKVFVPYNGSPLTEILKNGLGGNSKTCLIACVTHAEDSMNESMSTLRFAMQASHVKNKVAKSEAIDEANKEMEKIASAGNALAFNGGKAVVTLPSGDLEVWGHFASTTEPTVVVLAGLGSDPSSAQGLIDAILGKGCQVFAPKLPGEREKDLDADVDVLIEFLDWIGLAQPVIYGRDWGAVRAIKLKILNTKRASTLVLENFNNKVDEKEFRARCKKDPGYCMKEYMGPFCWMYDSAFPSSLDGKPGVNMTGFKGKVRLLWPLCTKGRHDPSDRSAVAKISTMFAKTLKTKVTDSYTMGDSEVADEIIACLPKA